METATPKAANNATPSQVFTALARIQQLVDGAILACEYTIQAVFGRDNSFEHFAVITQNRKGGDRIAVYFPGDGMAMVLPQAVYDESPHLRDDLAVILRILTKEEPTNPSNYFPRPIEEHNEIYGSSWAGGSGCGGVKLLAMSTAFPRVDLNAGWGDATPEVEAFRDVVDKGMRLVTAAMNRLNYSTDSEIIQQVKDQKERLLGLFGDRKIYACELPNGYGGKDDPYWGMFPWFQVTTTRGVIKIGWRKRVINIDWADSDIVVDAKALFAEDNTTTGDTYVHAWGYEKAQEYLDKLLNSPYVNAVDHSLFV